MLSPLQRRLRQIIDTIPEAADVALAGGGALIVRGVVARPTSDLDYFATSLRDVDRLLPALEARLEREGIRTRRVQDHPASPGSAFLMGVTPRGSTWLGTYGCGRRRRSKEVSSFPSGSWELTSS